MSAIEKLVEFIERQAGDILVCDSCGKLHIDEDPQDATDHCECTRMLMRMDWASDVGFPAAARAELAEFKRQRKMLRDALIRAKGVIRTWHNMDLSDDDREPTWKLYDNGSPEMRVINKALEDTPDYLWSLGVRA